MWHEYRFYFYFNTFTIVAIVGLLVRFINEKPPRSLTFLELCAAILLIVLINAVVMYAYKRFKKSMSNDEKDVTGER